MLKILALIALISSFTATAAVSVPAAVGGLAVYAAKDYAKDFTQKKLVEFAKAQGANKIEAQKFSATAEWLIEKAENVMGVVKFSKVAINPMKHCAEAKQIYETGKSLSKYGVIALSLKKDINLYSNKRKTELLVDVISKLGE